MALAKRLAFLWLALSGLTQFAPPLLAAAQESAQNPEEYFQVAGEHPRLLLTARRLRLLRRERERRSPRWVQFETLVQGNARFEEPGWTQALYYQVARDAAAGQRAIAFALSPNADARQTALVFDWCEPLLAPEQRNALAQKLLRVISSPPGADTTFAMARDRAFAAITIADEQPQASERELERLVKNWWRRQMAPALESGHLSVHPADWLAMMELLHAVQDSLRMDLRESARAYFVPLPVIELLSYYPAVFPAPENDFRIPALKGAQPDVRVATIARAAGLALVAFDSNALDAQFLQGWLMHDRFMMRGSFGAPYEFLWANPYQPGLSYYHAPLHVHDVQGQFFVRSSWDDDALWLGILEGEVQAFRDGAPSVAKAGTSGLIAQVGEAVVLGASARTTFQMRDPVNVAVFTGLKPSALYRVEADGYEMSEQKSGAAGVMIIDFPGGFTGTIVVAPPRF